MRLGTRLENWWLWKARWWRPIRALKFALQRLWYGVSERATWSLDMSIAKSIVKDLKAFDRWGLKEKYGYPGWLDLPVGTPVDSFPPFSDMRLPDPDEDSHYDETSKLVWFAIVHRLIDGFERISTGEHCSGGYEPYEEDTVALFEQVLPMLWT